MKTIAIIGAGPGLGMSLAKKFGEKGFKVAAIARNPEKLAIIMNELNKILVTLMYSNLALMQDPIHSDMC
ncbi:SDR family NAD(P)-dependent oxidoreductase [Paenibacillus popilliae]|uniref:Short-chain dehydrogenase n=1 Tax=Paenibacillus popilliae ATCC 14706 TaxID=1212764 RepID=M9M0L6_PAEPP|nr:SDR family NAD(P)-dependent oxidoreductase [Paenibacillus popilliae]GAC42354.1 short-chain dehydrogenase [Paenibacillus popilliae ATCC 14706]